MSFEVVQKVGRHKYIYLSESKTTEEGKQKQKRRVIGKIDPETGQKVYKKEYLDEVLEAQLSKTGVGTCSLPDLSDSLVLLFYQVAQQAGLTARMRQDFPEKWETMYLLACFSIAFSDAFQRRASQIREMFASGLDTGRGDAIELMAEILQRDLDKYDIWTAASIQPKESTSEKRRASTDS